MTDEKKIEEQAPEQGEEKVEAVVLDENVLEQLLVGCIWDVLRRMHRVATKAITPDQATRRTMPLRVTSPARSWVRIPASRARFRSSVPRSSRSCASFPTMPRTSSPRRSTVPIRAPSWSTCRTFLHGIYDMVRTLTKADEMTPEKLSETVNSTAALWTLRFTGRRADKLN